MAQRFIFANKKGNPCWSASCLPQSCVFAAVRSSLCPTHWRGKWQIPAHGLKQQEMFQDVVQEQLSGFLLIARVLLTLSLYWDFTSSCLKKWHGSYLLKFKLVYLFLGWDNPGFFCSFLLHAIHYFSGIRCSLAALLSVVISGLHSSVYLTGNGFCFFSFI